MLLYLDLAYDEWKQKGLMRNLTDLRDAIYHGAVKRRAPQSHDRGVIIAGLLPIMWSHGSGADVMKRIAAPMVGGVVTSAIMELVVYPGHLLPVALTQPGGSFGDSRRRRPEVKVDLPVHNNSSTRCNSASVL